MQWSLLVPFIETLLLNKGDNIWIQNNHARIDNLILYSTYTVFIGETEDISLVLVLLRFIFVNLLYTSLFLTSSHI